MNPDGRVAVVTGGAGGIGAALAQGLAAAGARVVVTDLDGDGAARVAERIGSDRALGMRADASSPGSLARALEVAADRFGPVDVFCANAGVFGPQGLGDEAAWELALEVNVLAHVRAARLLLPGWLERGSGHFLVTASAAGLLTQVGAAPYSATKHAAVGFAEWLSVTYGDRGVGVTCVCPMGVRTAMIDDAQGSADAVAAAGAILEPEQVAACALEAMEQGRFLALPHPEVLEFHRRKADDHDRWIRGMRRLRDVAAGH